MRRRRWTARWWRSLGIVRVTGELDADGTLRVARPEHCYWVSLSNGEHFATRSGAAANAERLRIAAVRSLSKQLGKIEDLKFD